MTQSKGQAGMAMDDGKTKIIVGFMERLLDGIEIKYVPLGDVTQYEQPTKYLVKTKNYLITTQAKPTLNSLPGIGGVPRAT